MRLGLVIYGTLDTVSGGYLYDRRLVATLRAQGHTVEIVSLPWRDSSAKRSLGCQEAARRAPLAAIPGLDQAVR